MGHQKKKRKKRFGKKKKERKDRGLYVYKREHTFVCVTITGR